MPGSITRELALGILEPTGYRIMSHQFSKMTYDDDNPFALPHSNLIFHIIDGQLNVRPNRCAPPICPARTQRAIDGWQTGQTTSVRLDANALDRGYGSRAGTAIAITSVGHPGVWYLESTNVALSRTEPHMVRLRSRGTQAAMNIQFALPPAPRPLRKVLHFTLPRCRK